MNYGDWKLRENSVYYNSQNVILYPSSNSSDKGSLHIESNVRSIVRRLTSKSYKLKPNDFKVSLSADRSEVIISPGEANIQGYHLIVNAPISIKVPESNVVTPWNLGLSLSYDAENNVTGDVVAYDKPLGQNEIFSGAYVYFFDGCQIAYNYDNILVLARIWEQKGKVVNDGTTINASDNILNVGRYIKNAVEPDPFNDHRYDADHVEIDVNGLQLTTYDTQNTAFDAKTLTGIPNITDVSMYDSTHYPVERNSGDYTKPPTFTTDIQDYINHLPDWYLNKYGDYMTGALRMDNLSIDAKMKLDPDNATEYIKDSAGTKDAKGKYHFHESVFISPRTLGNLTNRNGYSVHAEDGGTIMAVIPQSYKSAGIDLTTNAGWAAITAQKQRDTGMVMQTLEGGKSRVVMTPGRLNTNGTVKDQNRLLIENITGDGTKPTTNDISQMWMDKGDIILDSYNGGVMQFYSNKSSTSSERTVKFLTGEYSWKVKIPGKSGAHAFTDTADHQLSETDKGLITNDVLIDIGSGCSTDGNFGGSSQNNHNPYSRIGNIVIASLTQTPYNTKLNTHRSGVIELCTPRHMTRNIYTSTRLFDINYKDAANLMTYVNVLPGIYTHRVVAEDYIQVGTSKLDDVLGNDAIKNTRSKVVIGKQYTASGSRELDWDSYNSPTIIEQDTMINQSSIIMNKLVPFTYNPASYTNIGDVNSVNTPNYYSEIGGIFSMGNIGCSDKLLDPFKGDSKSGDLPYTNDQEWVRFTKFRYDKDNDSHYGGTENENKHAKSLGSTYNIEFNTQVSNRRANQIIWQYKGANGENNQPLVLSYIHDDKAASNGTKYPNETYYDHNMYLHQNPTRGVRDFLRLDGGGLSIHGDLNNPTLAGDEQNATTRFGLTLVQGRIYSSVYNDYAETYEKANKDEVAEEGMIIAMDLESGKFKICDTPQCDLVVGVISDNYGMLLGGKTIDTAQDHVDSVRQSNNFAVGVMGKVKVNVDKEVYPGELLVSSSKKGLATTLLLNKHIPGTIIGKVISKTYDVPGKSYKQCLMQIMLS